MRKLSVSVMLIAIFAVLVSLTTVSAQESSEVKNDDELEVLENVGESHEPAYVDEGKGEISLLGLGVPSNIWNISSKGQYDFSGSAQSSTLYTNYLLTGQSSYSVRINNLRNDTLRVDLMQKNDFCFDSNVRTWNVSPGANLFSTQTGLSSSNNYYLRFHAPSNFSGHIR
ncbi:hypothetical protein SAMN04488134_12116 [Amphibacillus marinus]|uniref:Uncharacterized protein n=1 Tax=Amphibacillus marinus TaxID=872970 RepID=A0A1H8TXP0_9BACI|nr:hypothetical protein SAMN04488134_12116 [Amphibacillus marinus]